MASRTNRQRILAGGLQLDNTPSDKLATGNSLILDNWRVDQGSQLKARRGSGKEAGPIGSGVFHTLVRTDNNRYAGIGPAFYFGTFLGTQLESGLTGDPLGIAFYLGYGWLMNPAKQRKFLGTQSWQWGVPPCPAACTAMGGGEITTPINEFEGGNIWVGITSPPAMGEEFSNFAMKSGTPIVGDTDGSGIVAAAFDSQNFKSGGGSLQMNCTSATGVTAYLKDLGLDSSVDGQVQDQDFVRVWVFASDPSKVTSVTVYVRSGNLTDPTSGYAEYTFTNPQQFLNQQLNSWTQLKIYRRLNLDTYSGQIATAVQNGDQQAVSDLEAQFSTAIRQPTFVYLGTGWPQTGIGAPQPQTYPPSVQNLNLDWTGLSEFGVSFQVSDICQVGVDLAEVVGAVNNNSTGAINYFVSFANQFNEDGIPGPASNAVIGGAQQITLNSIPVSSSPDVTQRYLWKIGGGLSQAYLVGVLPDNSTTTFVDMTTNAQLQDDDIVMPGTNIQDSRDLPPPAYQALGPFFGKILLFRTDLHPARMWWTPSGQPWYVPGALDEEVGNWIDVGPDDDPIVKATDHKQMAIIYKQRSIWRLPGDPDTTDPVKTNSTIGLVGANAVANAGLLDYVCGPEGVYSFNGDYETKVSTPIDAIFKGDFVDLEDGTTLPPLNIAAINTVALSVINDRLRVSYPQSGGEPNAVAVMHIPSGKWTREIYNLAAPAFTVMNYEGPGALQMAGATGTGGGGYLYHLESGYLDDSGPYHAVWQSAYYDQDLPDNLKVYTDIEIDAQTMQGQSGNTTLTVYAVFDNGTQVTLGTITSGSSAKPRQTFIFKIMAPNGTDLGRTAKNVAIRIEGNILGVVIIYGAYVHWYPEERTALSWDTGITDLGMPERVKEIDYLEFYMQGSGQQLSKVLYSDLPGSMLVSRDTQAVTAPNGRGTPRFRLAAPIDGRFFRLWMGNNPSGSTFQLFRAQCRFRPIGEYIDGTIGEYFECPEFSIAPNRVGELKDFALDYDSAGGGGSLVVYSDLPGNSLQIVRTIPIPDQSRALRVFPMEIPQLSAPGGSVALPYGQLFKVRIIPNSGAIIRLHGRAQFRARIIGVYFDGTRGEIWSTQPMDLLGGIAIFREIKIICQTTGAMFLEMRTELPGQQVSDIAAIPINTTTSTQGRLPITSRLPGTAKGNLQEFRLVGNAIARIFEVQVLARRLQTTDAPWDWVTVPLEPTPNEWANVDMPVRQTPEAFSWVDLAVDSIE